MSSNRRHFIKTLASSSAGFAIFSSFSMNHHFFLNGNSEESDIIFPFFDYVEKYNIGDFNPKDQGGKFVQMELLGTEDDNQITELIRNGLLTKTYGNNIGWTLYEKTEIEKSVWLNRFYFSPSFARMYYLTGDVSYVDDMMQVIIKWIDENPLQIDTFKNSYNWRDMQVAWRSINWSWCYFLTEKALSEEQKEKLLNALKEHGSILLKWFGDQPLNEFNHQSHGALAMLYLGVLFPSFEDAEKLKDMALKILAHHLQHAFYSDGGNVEQMFGYYPFEAHIFRDTYLLCIRNNVEMPSNLVSMLEKIGNFLAVVSQPDGTMPQVNDSYEMTTVPILTILNGILKSDKNSNSSISQYFPDTQIAVINAKEQDNSWYLLAYPGKTIGAHAHAGRLSFTAWYNNRPLFIDSGCCNYDNPLLVSWYRTSRAHNTVIIDGKSDEATSTNQLWVGKRTTQNRIVDWVENELYTFCRMTSPESESVNVSVKWSRSLAVVKNEFLIIHDCFETKDEHNYEVLFHFPQIQVSETSKKGLRLYENNPIAVIPATKKIVDSVVISEGLISKNGKNISAPIATYQFQKKGTLHSIFVVIPDTNSQIKIKQKNNSEGTAIKIITKNNKEITVLMKNKESNSLQAFGFETTKVFDVFQ
jgi:hypothetical protein